jgi:Carboxypeptidase Taq (M32) metallopeptidase
VRAGLVPLLKEIREKGTPPDSSVLSGTFDRTAQSTLADEVAKDLGFDLERGRLDVSVHPFTGGVCPLPPGSLTSNMSTFPLFSPSVTSKRRIFLPLFYLQSH